MSEWRLIAANCGCCAGPVRPLRLELLRAVFESVGFIEGYGYFIDGEVDLTARIVYSNGAAVHFSNYQKMYVRGADGFYAGVVGPVFVDGYRTPAADEAHACTFTDVITEEAFILPVFAKITPTEYVERVVVGDGVVAISSREFVKSNE